MGKVGYIIDDSCFFHGRLLFEWYVLSYSYVWRRLVVVLVLVVNVVGDFSSSSVGVAYDFGCW